VDPGKTNKWTNWHYRPGICRNQVPLSCYTEEIIFIQRWSNLPWASWSYVNTDVLLQNNWCRLCTASYKFAAQIPQQKNSAEAVFFYSSTGCSDSRFPLWDCHVHHFTSQLDIYKRRCLPNGCWEPAKELVNDLSCFSQHLAEFLQLSAEFGSIPADI